MGYVYRYAGMLEQAASECNTALTLDPGNYTFRSCAWAFMELGKTDRAAAILSGSMRGRNGRPMCCLRFCCAKGSCRSARSGEDHANDAALSSRFAGGMSAITASLPTWIAWRKKRKLTCRPIRTQKPGITKARIFAYCGKKQAALHMLQSAIEQNYCAYSNLAHDPLLAKLRTDTGLTMCYCRRRLPETAIRAASASA